MRSNVPEPASEEEASLEDLARDARQNEASLNELLRRIRPTLIRYAVSKGRGVGWDAEDLVQDTLIRITRHIRRYDPARAKFNTWSRRILYNLLLNQQRDERRYRQRTEEYGLATAVRRDQAMARHRPDVDCEIEELARNLREAAEQLPVAFREVTLLRFEDQSYEEIANACGVDLGTVKSRLNRGRNLLSSLPQIRAHRL